MVLTYQSAVEIATPTYMEDFKIKKRDIEANQTI